MLIKVYKNSNSFEKYINVKDIKEYFIESEQEKGFFTLKIKTYKEEIYDITWWVTLECYKYIMDRIGLAIKNEDCFIDVFEIQNYFENNSFYNYCNGNFNSFDDKTKAILDKVMTETSSLGEIYNLNFCLTASKTLNDEEKEIFDKIKGNYDNELEYLDSNLNKYLR